ncbi:hypothetical protein DRA24_22750, partial [Salmonella enterica subsp. enterica serovar Mississippi]|nr:hypothetical protein [Salmonella enterica subsp. enterica serovar Mississippi]
GDENHRPGFDTKTPGAFLNRACSGPEGASAASQSPLTAIFKKELVRKYGLLYLNFLFLL